jgi:CRISPR-associated protein Csy3
MSDVMTTDTAAKKDKDAKANQKRAAAFTPLETGMIAFTRSMQISEGLFYGVGKKQDNSTFEFPIKIEDKGVRGQSSESKAKKPGKSNPQTVQKAVMPPNCDTLELRFSVRVMPFAMKPSASDSPTAIKNYQIMSKLYAQAGGFKTLAELYVWNIVNGRFSWRNRFQSDKQTVKIMFGAEKIIINPLQVSLDYVVDVDAMASAIIEGSTDSIRRLISGLESGLAGDSNFNFSVVWSSELNVGQEIFPSQEYIREAVMKEPKNKDFSRFYAYIPTWTASGEMVMQASMHSQKIGAAIRCIDIWHGSDEYAAIPVNPYGGVQETATVLRGPATGRSFYDLRKKFDEMVDILKDARTGADIPGDIHFIMANLVRGGVFGVAKDKEDAKDQGAGPDTPNNGGDIDGGSDGSDDYTTEAE